MTSRVNVLSAHLCASTSSTKSFTKEELSKYTGEDGTPVYLCLKGTVFDVTAGKGFYGPGGGYAVLAGKDASRALAKMDLSAESTRNPRVDDLDAKEKDTLNSWYDRLKSKYPVVGELLVK
jgi:membrane-associated progesterone receptor component